MFNVEHEAGKRRKAWVWEWA